MTPWILITAGIAILSSAVSAILFTARARKKVTYMLDALEDNETNFRFREDKGMGRRFNRTLNRLRKIFEREKEEIRQQEQYYGQMLDHVQTGIAVIGNDGEHVEYCNAKALALLGVSSLSSIRQLKRINPPLADAFSKVTEGHKEKAGCSNESSTMTFSECDTGRSQPHQHHSRNQHRRKCRGQCQQQRHACQQGKQGRDIHTVLHHKTIRHRHRAEYLAADNEDAQRQHQTHRKQRKRNYIYTDVQIIIPRQTARRPVPQAWPPQHHPCPEADCRQTHGI